MTTFRGELDRWMVLRHRRNVVSGCGGACVGSAVGLGWGGVLELVVMGISTRDVILVGLSVVLLIAGLFFLRATRRLTREMEVIFDRAVKTLSTPVPSGDTQGRGVPVPGRVTCAPGFRLQTFSDGTTLCVPEASGWTSGPPSGGPREEGPPRARESTNGGPDGEKDG